MSPRAVTPLLGLFRRYILGFGVTLSIGLAPFLGKVKVPGFVALLEVVPLQLQDALIPLSAFLMGLIAVAVQFYAGEDIAPGYIRSLFGGGLATVVVGLILFTTLSSYFVERQEFGSQSVGVLVTDSRRPGCACSPQDDNNACIKQLSLAEEALDSCWGGPSFQRRKLSLSLTYLFLTGGFASLIGLLLLQMRNRPRRKRIDAKPAPATPVRRAKRQSAKGVAKKRPGAGRKAGRAPAPDDSRDRR